MDNYRELKIRCDPGFGHLRPATPTGTTTLPIPTWTSSTAGSTGSSQTPTSTKPSSKPPTARTTGFMSAAVQTQKRTAIKFSENCENDLRQDKHQSIIINH